MYTESTNGGLLKSIILKILFVALFIFLLLWLYPRQNTKPFYDAIFNNNINQMKEVAEDYYTVQRLPQEVGEVSKLTLQEMLDMKLLLPFTDKNGEYCDNQKSFVQVTKLENDEYELKVTLSCNEKTDYIVEYLGCHDLCVDGKCEQVVETLEYKFVRELFKGRKLSTVDLYKYEYTKQEKEAYEINKQVTYYKGKKKATEDVYSYEYQKPENYVVTTTYYKGKKKLNEDVYSYEYQKLENYNVTTTYYKGKKKLSEDVYSYEYQKNVSVETVVYDTYYKGRKLVQDYIYEYKKVISGTKTCKAYYNQSTVPSGAVGVESRTTYTQVFDGYTYGPWTTTSTYTSSSPCSGSGSDTSRVSGGGYSVTTGKCGSGSKKCPGSSITYTCSVQSRSKTPKYKQVPITVYSYSICSTSPDSVETKWAKTNPGSGWTATGNSKVSGSSYEYTGWVKTLPAGYTLYDTKTVSRTVVTTETKTQWSTEDLTKQGWTKTGKSKLISAGQWDYTDWVEKLPAGYTQIDKKEVTTVKQKIVTQWSTEDLTKQGWTKTGKSKLISAGQWDYTDWVEKLPAGYTQIDKKEVTTVKQKIVTQWSTEDLTKQGWTKTGKSKLISAGQYVYTDWVEKLPAGYTQTDKKTVTIKDVAYKTVTKKEWSTEDLTKQGWTKTGKKEKVGTTESYVYTDWVEKLPAGYTQTDKKTEVKWSTSKTLSGWTFTNESRIKED